MSKELYFTNVDTIGDLFLEVVFNTFENENLVFTCVDFNEQRYLCVCYEMRQTLEWVVCSIEKDTLIKIIKKEKDILYAFRTAKKMMQIQFEGEKESSKVVNYGDFNQRFLPNPDIFLKPDLDMVEYLKIFDYFEHLFEVRLNVKIENDFFVTETPTEFFSDSINESNKLQYDTEKQESVSYSLEYNENDTLAA